MTRPVKQVARTWEVSTLFDAVGAQNQEHDTFHRVQEKSNQSASINIETETTYTTGFQRIGVQDVSLATLNLITQHLEKT